MMEVEPVTQEAGLFGYTFRALCCRVSVYVNKNSPDARCTDVTCFRVWLDF